MLSEHEKQRLKLKEIEKILQALQSAGSEGLSLLRLTLKTRIRITDLNFFFRSHRNLFDGSGLLRKVSIAKRAPISGNVDAVRIALEHEHAEQKENEKLFYFAIGFAMIMSVFSTFLAVTA